LPRALEVHHPRLVILELGGNDGLRALNLDQMRTNLAKMVDLSTSAGARVLILGIRIPPNYGPEYTEQFRAVFGDVAREKKVPSVPFLLAEVALDAKLMQADGIHPNELGQPKLLDSIWRQLEPLLRK
jgi:acyl-CoA thioesterase-1